MPENVLKQRCPTTVTVGKKARPREGRTVGREDREMLFALREEFGERKESP